MGNKIVSVEKFANNCIIPHYLEKFKYDGIKITNLNTFYDVLKCNSKFSEFFDHSTKEYYAIESGSNYYHSLTKHGLLRIFGNQNDQIEENMKYYINFSNFGDSCTFVKARIKYTDPSKMVIESTIDTWIFGVEGRYMFDYLINTLKSQKCYLECSKSSDLWFSSHYSLHVECYDLIQYIRETLLEKISDENYSKYISAKNKVNKLKKIINDIEQDKKHYENAIADFYIRSIRTENTQNNSDNVKKLNNIMTMLNCKKIELNVLTNSFKNFSFFENDTHIEIVKFLDVDVTKLYPSVPSALPVPQIEHNINENNSNDTNKNDTNENDTIVQLQNSDIIFNNDTNYDMSNIPMAIANRISIGVII
jgi:hypothetical protein